MAVSWLLLAFFVAAAACLSLNVANQNGTVLVTSIQTNSANDPPLKNSTGHWEVDPGNDRAGGVERVSGDGPKPLIKANPVIDIGWFPPVTTEMILSHPNYKYLPSLSECGFPAKSDQDGDETGHKPETGLRKKRIVGGQTAPLQAHPWMVQLYLYNIASREHLYTCAGTLITNSTILTAAHCVTRIAAGSTLDVVVIGIGDRTKIKFCKTSNPHENCSRKHIRVIDDFEVHDEYSEGNAHNDIALIYLKKPLDANEFEWRAVCLPYTSQLLDSWSNLKLTVAGWGLTSSRATSSNSLSDLLKQVEIDLQPRSLCDHFHIRMYGRMEASRICTAGNTGRASCNGDSGGSVVKSLTVPEKDGMERVFQMGIVSAGGLPVDTCGNQGRPSIDTNVFYFMNWILNHIAPGVLSYHYVKNSDKDNPRSLWNEGEAPSQTDSKVGNEPSTKTKKKLVEQYLNEFSTGTSVDVSQHPSIHLLPSWKECGNLPTDWKQEDADASEGKCANISSRSSSTLKHESKVEEKQIDSIEMMLEDAVTREKRIVGGVPVHIENFYPWMAQIYVRNVETNELTFWCGGTVISKRNILSAAHCVTEVPAPFVLDSVVVGQYNRNATKECIEDTCFSPIRMKISDVVVHPGFEMLTHRFNIALIRLSANLHFTNMVQPICLPRSEDLIEEIIHQGKYFTAGWGRFYRNFELPPDRMSEILLQIYVDILPRRTCDFVYSRTIALLDRSRICAGSKASQGECLGDGGGPLMKKVHPPNHIHHKKIFQLGVVSFSDCGMQGMPTVYMNIIYFMKWILNNLDDSDEN